MTFGFPRPELTVHQKLALGRLMGAYARGQDYVSLEPSNPLRAVLDTMVGSWVERAENGRYKITNYGMNAYYRGKIVKVVR